MARTIHWVLASVLATSGGFALGRWSTIPWPEQVDRGAEVRQSSGKPVSSSSGQSEGWQDAERRFAQLCAKEAARVVGSSGQLGNGAQPTEPSQTEERLGLLRSQLADIVGLVEEKGMWSRGAGVKARYLLHQLPRQDAAALAERLEQAQKSGEVTLQAGAWVPSVWGG